jgi:hypothetical protein
MLCRQKLKGARMPDTFSNWLNSAECFNDLLPCARLVIRRAEQLGITLDDSYMENGNVQEYQSAVASDLYSGPHIPDNSLRW